MSLNSEYMVSDEISRRYPAGSDALEFLNTDHRAAGPNADATAAARNFRKWLQDLNLNKYEEILSTNGICDINKLSGCCEDSMLSALGIPLGPRRKIQAALKQLNSPQWAGDSHLCRQTTPAACTSQDVRTEFMPLNTSSFLPRHPSNSATAPCPDPSEKGSAPAGTMGTALAGPVTCHSRAGHSHPAVTSASDIGNNDFASMSAPPWQQQGQKPSNIGRSSPAPCTLPGVKQLQDGSATLITPCISPGVKRLQDSSAALITPARKLTKPPARCQPGTGKHPNEPHKKQRQGNRSKKGACPVTSPIGCGLGEKELMNVLYPSSENAIKAGSTPKLPRVTARSKGRSHNRKGGKGGTEPNLWHAGSSCLLPKLFDLELLKRPLLTSLRNNVEISASSPIEQAFISFGCMRRRVLNKIFSPQQPVNGAVPMETLKGEASTYPSKQACENTAARSGTLFELPNPSNNRDALRNAEIRRSESHALNVSRLQALQSELAAARRTVETLEGMVQEAEIAAGVHPGGSCEAAKARPDSSFGTGAAKPDTSFVDVPEARAQEHMSHQDSECISTDLISILDDSGDESDRWY